MVIILKEHCKNALILSNINKEFRYSHKYSLKLAEYYLENKKYKKAAIQYKKANEYLALKENRKFTEDL